MIKLSTLSNKMNKLLYRKAKSVVFFTTPLNFAFAFWKKDSKKLVAYRIVEIVKNMLSPYVFSRMNVHSADTFGFYDAAEAQQRPCSGETA